MAGDPTRQGAGERCDTDRFLLALYLGLDCNGRLKIGVRARLLPCWEDRVKAFALSKAVRIVNEAEAVKKFACV